MPWSVPRQAPLLAAASVMPEANSKVNHSSCDGTCQQSPTSPTSGNGALISGSDDPWDFRHNNGGQDFFGLPVPDTTAPTIGALQRSLCAESTFWNANTNQCEPHPEPCPEDLDGDGTVSVFDLLMLLTALPTTC